MFDDFAELNPIQILRAFLDNLQGQFEFELGNIEIPQTKGRVEKVVFRSAKACFCDFLYI
jgi:hypothetical protein